MKRTYQPSKLVRKRRHGFRARLANAGGRKVLAAACAWPQASERLSRNFRRIIHGSAEAAADFLAVANGTRVNSAAFVVQGRPRDDDGPIRIGFTVTKKNGTATERNRIRRRLRELVKRMDVISMRPHHDYVLVGRRSALTRDFGSCSTISVRRCIASTGSSESDGRAANRIECRDPRTMTENRNTILAVILSGLVLIAWQYFYNMPQMERQRAQTQTQAELQQASVAKQLGSTAPAQPRRSPALRHPHHARRPAGRGRPSSAAKPRSRPARASRSRRLGFPAASPEGRARRRPVAGEIPRHRRSEIARDRAVLAVGHGRSLLCRVRLGRGRGLDGAASRPAIPCGSRRAPAI